MKSGESQRQQALPEPTVRPQGENRPRAVSLSVITHGITLFLKELLEPERNECFFSWPGLYELTNFSLQLE